MCCAAVVHGPCKESSALQAQQTVQSSLISMLSCCALRLQQLQDGICRLPSRTQAI